MNITTLSQQEIDHVEGGKTSYPHVTCFLINTKEKQILATVNYPNICDQGEYRKTRYIPKKLYKLEDDNSPNSKYVCFDDLSSINYTDYLNDLLFDK